MPAGCKKSVNVIVFHEFLIRFGYSSWDDPSACDEPSDSPKMADRVEADSPDQEDHVRENHQIPDVQNLEMELKVNGKIMQKGNTNKMIFNINHIVCYLSHFMTLFPGDIITTGTPPGVGMGKKPQKFLEEGDEMTLCINKLGFQKQKIVKINRWIIMFILLEVEKITY